VVISGDGEGGARHVAAGLEAQGLAVHATWRGGAVVSELSSPRGGSWDTRYWYEPAAVSRRAAPGSWRTAGAPPRAR
jgi:hypothetical protein